MDEALAWARVAQEKGEALSIGLLGNAAEVLPELLKRNVIPDTLTDQTSAHDELNGYIPHGMAFADALALRKSDPEKYIRWSMNSMLIHCETMVELMKRGAVTFDYGNN